jgi:hypothetical protein
MTVILSDPLYSSFYEKEFLSNPIHAFGGLVLFVFIGWILFVKLFPLTMLQWKKTDCLWLSLSAIGLFGLLADNRILFSKNELEICNVRIDVYAKATKRNINNEYFCTKFIETENSPDDFDDTQKEFDAMCNWKEAIYYRIDSIINEQKNINIDELEIPQIKNLALKQLIDYLIHNINEYNEYINKMQTIIANMNYKEYENMLRIVSPLILIIGLSIRFTKTLGEISLQKEK